MDSYTFALALGGAGLVTMAATGLAHSGSHDAAHVDAHPGIHVGHSHGLHSTVPHHTGALKSTLLSIASPRTLFSLLVGFGLTGIVVRAWLSGPLLVLAALLGAVVFERAVVNPLWRFLFRFASHPAMTLEGSLMTEARATSGFDANGQGLVAVEVDGQIVQCLGTLKPDDLSLGVRVRAGDVLRVEDVDPVRNRCSVSYVGHSTHT
jgi:hypothetical protein